MEQGRTYPLRLPAATKALALMMLGIFTLAGFTLPIGGVARGEPSVFVVAAIWLGIVAFLWYLALSLPQSIVHRADDVLEFRSPLRDRRVSIGDLRSIEPVPNQFGFFRFRHSGGTITVLIHFDGFHELVHTIKEKNPGIRLRGC